MNIVSFGGGTNSTAMIIGMHERGIPIDLIIFADTGGERPETYAFIETLGEWLSGRGLPKITTIQQTRHGEPETLESKCLRQNDMPSVAYGYGKCAVEFKIKPQERHCNNNADCKAMWERGEKVNKYIGYDAGEQRRINKNQEKHDADKKYAYHFPLLEWGWSREECIDAITRAGLPLPGKSSCFYCPNNKKAEIERLWKKHPDLFARAVAMERNVEKTRKDGTPSSIIGLGRTWTWESYKDAVDAQISLFDYIDEMGGCCCGMPCGCNDG